MDEFTAAYIECALWASTDDVGEPLDGAFSVDDLAPQTRAAMQADCDDFRALCEALLDAAYSMPGYDPGLAGHDFWLTRNRHGAGYWDRGLGVLGDRLTAAAECYGSCDLVVGDDGQIYGE